MRKGVCQWHDMGGEQPGSTTLARGVRYLLLCKARLTSGAAASSAKTFTSGSSASFCSTCCALAALPAVLCDQNARGTRLPRPGPRQALSWQYLLTYCQERPCDKGGALVDRLDGGLGLLGSMLRRYIAHARLARG